MPGWAHTGNYRGQLRKCKRSLAAARSLRQDVLQMIWSNKWGTARMAVPHLSLSSFENPRDSILRIPEAEQMSSFPNVSVGNPGSQLLVDSRQRHSGMTTS